MDCTEVYGRTAIWSSMGGPNWRKGRRTRSPSSTGPFHTATAQGPEQISVLVLAGMDQPAFGRDEIHRDQVVARHAVLSAQPAHATAQRQSRDAGVGERAPGGRQTECLGLGVELSPLHARLGAGDAIDGIDTDRLHQRAV